MKISDGMAALEAILFACGDPIDIAKLSAAADMDTDTAEKLLAKLNDRYDTYEGGLRVLKLGDSYQLVTREKFAANIKQALESKRQVPLSQAAMEVLAIIAYNQPVTKGFVEQVRGIDSSSVVNSLVERNLLEEHGRLDLPGRPIAYKTTDNFLRCFKMSDLKELPPLPNSSDQVNFDEIEELNRLNENDTEYSESYRSEEYDYGEEEDGVTEKAVERVSDDDTEEHTDDNADTLNDATGANSADGGSIENATANKPLGDTETDGKRMGELFTDSNAGVSNEEKDTALSAENREKSESGGDIAENSALNEQADIDKNDDFDELDDIDITDTDIDSIDDTLKIISDNIAEITSES